MKNILFITWDGPQTNYMEGLFMPIFDQIQKNSNCVFHVIQFSWGDSERIAITQKAAQQLNIIYTPKSIVRKPIAVLGTIFTLFNGIRFLKKYIKENNICIVMPRSTMPAVMVNQIKKSNFKLLFDADGLPLEERIDFSGWSKNSSSYKLLKNQENKIILNADGVITRSNKSIAIHLAANSKLNANKFSVVYNGRDQHFFLPNALVRGKRRSELSISEDTVVFVYCGSLGLQYGFDEMMAVFSEFCKINSNAIFLILTGDIPFAKDRIPTELSEKCIVKSVPFEEIPNYLSIADIAFAIREPKWSMQGVAPIKLGEYLLMGIPTIASAGIGDTKQILETVPNCSIFNHESSNRILDTVASIEGLLLSDRNEIRKAAMNYFTIEKSLESYLTAIEKVK